MIVFSDSTMEIMGHRISSGDTSKNFGSQSGGGGVSPKGTLGTRKPGESKTSRVCCTIQMLTVRSCSEWFRIQNLHGCFVQGITRSKTVFSHVYMSR